MAEHIRSVEDLHDCLVLFSSRAWNSLKSELWWSRDVKTVQQIPKSAGGDRGFISSGLDLIGVAVRLLLFGITQGSVVLIIFVFILISFFFFSLVVFLFFLMIIVIVVVVVVDIVLWQLLSFFYRFLSFFSRMYHNHDLKGILLLRKVLRRVRLRLWLRWYIPWHQLTSGLTYSALTGCAARMNHLKFRNRRQ
jgi:hypothetical protein